ncbi:helix-turn-helix domain-containing protein [Azospirillum sp.]|uniref:helix-turn-helix domain-containing protein n=1 Tax=Azospirillum sp. TaxID=34012 RepID=UPI003D755A2D
MTTTSDGTIDSTTDGALPVHRFDSGAMAPEEAFWIWRDQMSPAFDVSVSDGAAVRTFRGSLEAYHLGSVLLTHCASVTQTFSRTPHVIARSGIDHYMVQLMLEGEFAGTMGQREVTVHRGDVCVIDLAQPLATVDRTFANLTLCIPREMLAPLLPAPDALHGLVIPGHSAVGALLGGHIRSLHAAAEGLSARDALAVARGSAGFVAGCLGPKLDALDLVRPEMHAARLNAIKRCIEDNLADPEFGAADICRTFGMSRPTLYRLFEPMGGVSAYILQRRLARSMAELVSAGQRQRIADIAYKWGFGSETSFSRAFRTAFGLSPRDARQGRPAYAAGMSQLPATVGSWLRTLAVL